MERELRPVWNKLFDFNWKFGLFLILIVCIPRFILVLFANASGNYQYIGLIMVVSAIAPFIFLTKFGRREIGIRKPSRFTWLLIAFAAGLIVSVLLHLIGSFLYDNTFQNWYQYIAKSLDKSKGFAVMAITGMIFSPIGEELFFRGIVHSSFAKSIGEKRASIVDSSAFALVHISHFGLVFINNKWDFFLIPTILWVMSMFLVSLMFFYFRGKAGSILGAIFCHSAFNLGMTYCIFYLL